MRHTAVNTGATFSADKTPCIVDVEFNKMLSYRRETALQSALVLAKSGRLELGDNILRTL